MIKNQYIDLDNTSLTRLDALNSIKYTLLLDYNIQDIADMDNPIPEIMKRCHHCCKGLFQDCFSNQSETDIISFNFFGWPGEMPNNKVEPTGKNISRYLSFLNSFPPNKKFYSIDNVVGFPTMILDHCVLSCYHAVLTDLLHGETVTAYNITNDLKTSGIHSLYKDNRLDFQATSRDILRKAQYHSLSNSKKSASASDFIKTAETHLKILPFAQSLFEMTSTDTNKPNNHNFFLQFSGIFSHICQIDTRIWKKCFLSTNKKSNQESTLQALEDLSLKLLPKNAKFSSCLPERVFCESFHDPVDGIYHYYILERMFNLNLFYCLLRNIHRIETNTFYRLCQKELFKCLCHCKKLPNSFSRQYFVQYAFDQLINEPMSYRDFWHNHRLDMSTSVIESPLKNMTHFQFARWLDQFSLFCDYMADYVIPIYEWCFTNMIMDVMKQVIPESYTPKIDHMAIHKKRLIKAMELLSGYMEQNYKQILRPIEFKTYQDILDIITEHKSGILDLNIPPDSLQQLFDLFFNTQDEINLNLIPLSPDFFLSGKRDPQYHNEKHIRNFYINILYPN